MNETGTKTPEYKITSNVWPETWTWPWYTPEQKTVAYRAYKCPCGGEFDELGITTDPNTKKKTHCCPFCERKMWVGGNDALLW